MSKSTSRCTRTVLSLLLMLSLSGAVFSLPPTSTADPEGGETPQDSLVAKASEAMRRSTRFMESISTHGGYAGIYSSDLRARYGEAKYDSAASAEIWIQPPGTPTVGESFLRAYRLTGQQEFLDASRRTARALAWGQHASGGWAHTADLSHVDDPSVPVQRREGGGTFDDQTTQGALIFLMELDRDIDEPWLTRTIERGLRFMLDSQFDNGAWPQWYPLDGGYSDYYTFNDRAINDCITVMLKAHALYADERYLASAEKAGAFIVASQMDEPQPAWAQQYDHDLLPAKARSFEPAAACSAVTANNIRTLTQLYLYSGRAAYLEPIPPAIDWLKRSTLREGTWARFYELNTNRPIYGDRDGRIHYRLEEISRERREGYAWHGSFGIPDAIGYYTRAAVENEMVGFDPALATTLPGPSLPENPDDAADAVLSVVSALDEDGRWLRDDEIRVGTFVDNFNLLADFLAREASGE